MTEKLTENELYFIKVNGVFLIDAFEYSEYMEYFYNDYDRFDLSEVQAWYHIQRHDKNSEGWHVIYA